MNKQDKISSKINLIKIPSNIPFEFELDDSTDWLEKCLREMNENATEATPDEYLEETFLRLNGVIEKKNKIDLGEYLIAKGTITSEYSTECVRTLKPMTVELNVPFKIIFLDEALAETELYENVDETYVDGDVFEIYFYSKRVVDFEEMIHEQIFLHYDQYPILDAESNINPDGQGELT
jgi:uncharacterized metal-binding protein YceD (DUF177 family)